MKISLILTSHFHAMLGVSEVKLTLGSGATVADAVRIFLDENPDHRATLDVRRGFLFGELRAIYSIDGQAVDTNHILADGDELKVLKAFIGG